MKVTFILCLSFLLFHNPTSAQEPYTQWLRTFGGLGNNYGRSVLQTTEGDFVIAGTTVSSSSWELGLFKRDSLGNSIWAKSFGGGGSEFGYSVQQTIDGGYLIVGQTSSFGNGLDDVWLIKTNSFGDTIWTRTYGGSDVDWGYAANLTNDGGYIIIGSTDSFSQGSGDVWLIKTDSLGIILWSRSFGGEWRDYASAVQQTFDGGYIIAGSMGVHYWRNGWLLKTDASGDTLWTKSYGSQYNTDVFSDVKQTNDGGYVVTGNTKSFGNEWGDVWLLKLDYLGDTIWTKTYGGYYRDVGTSVQQTIDEGYIISGYTENYGAEYTDVLLVKVDSLGELQWNKTFGFYGDDRGYEVRQTLDGGYIITGSSNSFGGQWEEAILIKLGPSADSNISVLYPNCSDKWFFGTTEEIHYWTTDNIENVKIEFSINNGDNWNNIVNSALNTGSYNWLVNADSASSECLIKISDALNNEVFDISDSTFSIDSIVVSIGSFESRQPVDFRLNQNYPNPFNPTTTIKYKIPELSFVTLKVFDVLGNEIATIVNEEKPVGSYEVEFDGTGFPSGIYFYKLLAGFFVETKKMILLK